jgi:hypothetical protein
MDIVLDFVTKVLVSTFMLMFDDQSHGDYLKVDTKMGRKVGLAERAPFLLFFSFFLSSMYRSRKIPDSSLA